MKCLKWPSSVSGTAVTSKPVGGHNATAASHAASTAVWQSGSILTVGNFLAIKSHTSSVALSSICLLDASLQIASVGSTARLSSTLGHLDSAISQSSSTAVLQSGSNFKDGNFCVMKSHTGPVSIGSISLCFTISHAIFSMSDGSMPRDILGHIATAESQAASTTVLQSGSNFMLGNFSVMKSQTSPVAFSSNCLSEANLQISFSMVGSMSLCAAASTNWSCAEAPRSATAPTTAFVHMARPGMKYYNGGKARSLDA
mmetsp:Transcript_43862/g.80128  ORF Transcript_43862/g.80128 Transcript_43862/m.80128 type:complete len:257 (+) Transcript_43862:1086-1856(+)